MALTLTVLGNGGSYAGPGNACSGYLVEAAGVRLWVDTGPGTLANVQRHVTSLKDIDAVAISHSHPDHWLDLPILRNAMKYFEHHQGVPLFTTAEVLHLADGLGHGEGMEPTFRTQAVADGDSVEVGGLRITFSRTDHPVETLAMRIDGDGTSLAYSADTAAGWSVEQLGTGIDAFICEASLLPEQRGLAPHITGAEAGAMASAAGVGRLLLTHLPPGGEEEPRLADAATTFSGPIEVLHVNQRYEL
jgi:ribonuclease BN (tRNA processing enzyme)